MSDEELLAMVRVIVAPCATVTAPGSAWVHRSIAVRAAAPSAAREARPTRQEVTHAR